MTNMRSNEVWKERKKFVLHFFVSSVLLQLDFLLYAFFFYMHGYKINVSVLYNII